MANQKIHIPSSQRYRERAESLKATHQELSESFMRLVEQELNRAFKMVSAARVEREDLKACAWIGFFEAKQRFDPRYEVSFTAFARQRVRGAIFDGLAELSPLGRNALRGIRRSMSVEELTKNELGISSTTTHSDHQDGHETLPVTFLERYQEVYQLAVSHWTENLADRDNTDPLRPLERDEVESEEKRLLSLAFDQLTDQQQEVLVAIYDLRRLGDSSIKYAERRGVHRSTVSRRHASALRKLRDEIKRLREG